MGRIGWTPVGRRPGSLEPGTSGFSNSIKSIVIDETNVGAGGPRCECCLKFSAGEFHHVCPRGVPGSDTEERIRWLHSYFNCSFLCKECHADHAKLREKGLYFDLGWLDFLGVVIPAMEKAGCEYGEMSRRGIRAAYVALKDAA